MGFPNWGEWGGHWLGENSHIFPVFLGGVSLTKKVCDWLVGGFLFGTEYGGEGVCSGTNHPVHKLTSFFGHVCKKNIQYWRNGRGEVGLCGKWWWLLTKRGGGGNFSMNGHYDCVNPGFDRKWKWSNSDEKVKWLSLKVQEYNFFRTNLVLFF